MLRYGQGGSVPLTLYSPYSLNFRESVFVRHSTSRTDDN